MTLRRTRELVVISIVDDSTVQNRHKFCFQHYNIVFSTRTITLQNIHFLVEFTLKMLRLAGNITIWSIRANLRKVLDKIQKHCYVLVLHLAVCFYFCWVQLVCSNRTVRLVLYYAI